MSMPKGGIVVAGMHRSGTSLVARLLAQLGVFMGSDLNVHSESEAWLDLNSRIFRLAHGDWDVPGPVTSLLSNGRVANDLLGVIAEQEWPVIKRKFLGESGLFRGLRRSQRWPTVWGWKDPRNSITLPLWRRCISECRVIHVYRNPADVALSLMRREQARYQIQLKRSTLRSFRCLDRELGAHLWTHYVTDCLRARQDWPKGLWFDLCYEDLSTAPLRTLQQLAAFVDFSGEGGVLKTLAEDIEIGRTYAFRNSCAKAWGETLIQENPQARRLGYPDRLGVLVEAG